MPKNRAVAITLFTAFVLSALVASVAGAKNDKNDKDDKKNKGRGGNEIERRGESQTGVTSSLAAEAANLTFQTFTAAGYPEQDVFVQPSTSTDEVWRVPTASTSAELASALYASASSTPRDPFQTGPTPLGPFPKGASLGRTLGQWLSATGTGTYTETAGAAALKLAFGQLIPNGAYTVWCSAFDLPPEPMLVDRPCGAADGSQNYFTADAGGHGSFMVALDPLPTSTASTSTVVAVVFHSDGTTHGATAGDYGRVSHTHLLATLPNALTPVPGPGPTPKPKPKPAPDLVCMQAATDERDNAIIAALDSYHADLRRALEVRRDALKNGWGIEERKARRAALRAAWDAFRKARRDEFRQLREAKKSAWKEYRADRKACGARGGDDHGAEGEDAQL